MVVSLFVFKFVSDSPDLYPSLIFWWNLVHLLHDVFVWYHCDIEQGGILNMIQFVVLFITIIIRNHQVFCLLSVLSKWLCLCYWLRWCNMPSVWYPCWPRDRNVFSRQHYMWYNISCLFQVWTSLTGWIWWFQL